jgi:lipooligosaccharide transport system ATP-binding protein
MAMAGGIAVSARNLFKRYGGVEAVRGIDFDVRSDECFGFLGPNGAGKTTTMKMISCSSPPSGGELSVLGLRAWVDGRTVKRRIGVIPQDNNLDEEVSVLENLVIYARYFGSPGASPGPGPRSCWPSWPWTTRRTGASTACPAG